MSLALRSTPSRSTSTSAAASPVAGAGVAAARGGAGRLAGATGAAAAGAGFGRGGRRRRHCGGCRRRRSRGGTRRSGGLGRRGRGGRRRRGGGGGLRGRRRGDLRLRVDLLDGLARALLGHDLLLGLEQLAELGLVDEPPLHHVLAEAGAVPFLRLGPRQLRELLRGDHAHLHRDAPEQRNGSALAHPGAPIGQRPLPFEPRGRPPPGPRRSAGTRAPGCPCPAPTRAGSRRRGSRTIW